MAGKTLTGIGEDESGKHELAVETSDANLLADKTPSTRTTAPSSDPRTTALPPTTPLPSITPLPPTTAPLSPTPSARSTDPMPLSVPTARATDRMPLSTIIGAPVPSQMAVVPPANMAVDEDKVAEGLKKLRSLDEPLGPIPSSMPTLKEGIAAVGAPTPVNPVTAAAAAAAELLRSRGTAHGHALSVAAGIQGTMPISMDDRMKGTLLGHSLHLPDAPPTLEEPESRPAEVREIARIPAKTLFVPAPEQTTSDFSRGDSRFFDTASLDTELEPENPRGKMMARSAIFVAVLSIFVVAAIAWWRAGKPENALPTEAAPALPPIKPSPYDNGASGGAPAAAAPTAAPVPAAVPELPAAAPPATAPAAAAPRPAPTVLPPPPPPTAAAPEEAKPPAAEPAHPRPKHHEAAAVPAAKPQAPASHAAKPAAPHAAPVSQPPHDTKPVVPGKHGKSDVPDPDGTLPLSD